MPSEMRRLANLLVTHRSASFPSAVTLEQSVSRLSDALAGTTTAASLRGEVSGRGARLAWGRGASRAGGCVFDGAWTDDGGSVSLAGSFAPSPATKRFLQATSIVLTALLGACAWAYLAPEVESATMVLATITLGLAMLVFPYVVIGLGARREAEETQIARALGRHLSQDGQTAPTPYRRWADDEPR